MRLIHLLRDRLRRREAVVTQVVCDTVTIYVDGDLLGPFDRWHRRWVYIKREANS